MPEASRSDRRGFSGGELSAGGCSLSFESCLLVADVRAALASSGSGGSELARPDRRPFPLL